MSPISSKRPNRIVAQTRLLLAVGLVLCQFASAAELGDRDWKLVTSQNFRVHTVLPVDRAVEMLRHLEVMRAAFDDPTATPTYQSSVPTVIIALDNDEDYLRVGAPPDTIGIFNANARANAIFLYEADGQDGVQVILHEYVHYLHRKNGRTTLPKWFEEGRAEYLSRSRLRDGNLEYGLPAKGRLPALRFATWLPSENLITLANTDSLDGDLGAQFYGQSWLLVHYLYSRSAHDSEVMKSVNAYTNYVGGGMRKADAFAKAFGIEVDELQDTLGRYLLKGDFKSRSVAVNTALPGFAPTVTSISPAQARIALGEMAMKFNNDVDAEQWFSEALGNDVTRAHAEAGLGTVEGVRGNIAAAEARFEASIYLVSYDFNIWMDYAQFWAQRISAADGIKQRLFFANRLEESLKNALTIGDATPELNSLMGFSHLARGYKEIEDAIPYLMSAIEQSPIDQGSRILLASAYLMDKQPQRAIEVANAMLDYEHEPSDITAAAHDIIKEATAMQDFDLRP